MLEAGEDKINIVVLGLKLSGWFRDMGRDHLFLGDLVSLMFRNDVDGRVTEGAGGDFVAVLIQDLEVFLGDLEDDAPDPLTDGRNDAGDPASPLGGPAGKGQGMVRHIGPVEKNVLRRPFFQLVGMKRFAVNEIFHGMYLYRMAFSVVKSAEEL